MSNDLETSRAATDSESDYFSIIVVKIGIEFSFRATLNVRDAIQSFVTLPDESEVGLVR